MNSGPALEKIETDGGPARDGRDEGAEYLSTSRMTLLTRSRELLQFRGLLLTLAWRDVRVRYKHSVLGAAWAMFIPVSMMIIFSFVFTRVVKVSTDVPYILYAYSGLLPWQFFASATTSATNSLLANRSLVTKIYFPAEVFPFSSILASFVDFLAGSLVLVGLMIYFAATGAAINLSWTIPLVVVVLFVQVLFTAGVSLFLAMGNLFFRDVRYIYSVVITLWMFSSSVVYPMKVDDPSMQAILNLNPMTPILDAYRDVLLKGQVFDLASFGYSAIVAAIIFFCGWALFYRLQHRFAEKA
ncbi:MAG TPA: ABC transporter permease [Thermodesulfobacteriota bacterium]